MSGFGSMALGGLFNAFTFAGAGYIFSKFNKDGYEKETRRHDLAMEQLARAQQEWNQKDIERQEKIAALRQERSDANADFKNINKALKDYEKVTELVFKGKKINHKPHIWDFYDPSDEMKEYMTIAIGSMGLVADGLVEKLSPDYYEKKYILHRNKYFIKNRVYNKIRYV